MIYERITKSGYLYTKNQILICLLNHHASINLPAALVPVLSAVLVVVVAVVVEAIVDAVAVVDDEQESELFVALLLAAFPVPDVPFLAALFELKLEPELLLVVVAVVEVILPVAVLSGLTG